MIVDHIGLLHGMTLQGMHAVGRVELSSGVEPAADPSYVDGAFVPRLPWRAPTCHERGMLFGAPRPGALLGDWIAVLPVPSVVLAAFSELRAASAAGSEPDMVALLDGPAGRTALVEVIRWAGTLTDPERPEIQTPVLSGRKPAGNLTMTTGDHGLRVGLHVDSWYGSPLEKRADAPNRLSVNLGSHDRALLCVNAPLEVMAHALRYDTDPRYHLGKQFMETFPDYPVTKIVIHPGEAYIAPTENMLHDGYAEPHGQLDLQFSCRGYFPSPASWRDKGHRPQMWSWNKSSPPDPPPDEADQKE